MYVAQGSGDGESAVSLIPLSFGGGWWTLRGRTTHGEHSTGRSLLTWCLPQGRHRALPVLASQQVQPVEINTITFKQGVNEISHLTHEEPQT